MQTLEQIADNGASINDRPHGRGAESLLRCTMLSQMGMSVNKAMNSLAQYYCYYYQQDGRKEIKFDNLTNMVTINEVFGLRNQGRKEEAYEAARVIFATDKSPYASAAMFWTAVDILKIRVSEDQMEEARKIHMALERLLPNVKDEKGWMHDAMKKCQALLEKGDKRERLLEEGPEHLKTGIWGEELAAAYLREKGYVILERDWHSKHRDIDIIAQQDEWIVFVEVKTRRSRDFSDPLQAINYQKQKNLRRAINHYINYRKLDNPWRFDVITIVGTIRTKTPEIEHIENFRLNCR